ncbi:GrpB family protein [Lysinibacillus sp. A1]|uniref:GrpB family protein n=1 Tax=Lysinibacillus sp. A1 TaxID=1571920 RepID=UPI00350FD4B9
MLYLEIIDIYHIGSTSVPGLRAKPIIDMMPVVKDFNLVDTFNLEMRKIGNAAKGENV